MSLREFYKSHYELELTRKTDLTAGLAVPVGILSLLVGALVIMAKELHAPFSRSELVVCVSIALSALASLVSTYFLFRSLYNFAYGYVATPLEIQNYQAGLLAFHEGTGQPLAEAKKLAEEETLEYVDSEYAKYADRNAKNNDIKSTFLHQANGAMIAAVICAGVAGGAYVFNSLSSPASVPKVEVVNLKEVSVMSPAQSIQAVTSPPPPPPPPPAVRPNPPPGRIVREDQRPPRPPPPPRP
jgi:hypothetical protein